MEEPMKIYNTLTRKKEEFQPIEEGKVRMYVCGPTVYNYIHIGNARPMIIFDTFRRYLEYKGYEVNYVSNFTDVDDKIIKEAIEEGITAEDVSARFIAECKKDMADLNLKPATTHPLATQEIDGMIEMIKTLIEKGYAYAAADGTVYYRTRKFEGYGKLSHKNIDDLEAGHRNIKVTGDLKEDPLDFVLWKPKKDGEPYWESPWCEGRPGWHIECSVMAKKYLALVAVADAFMLGGVDQNYMSAVSLATQIQFIQNMFLTAATASLGILGAQYWGKGDLKTLDDIFCMALRLCGLVSVVFFAACMFIPKYLMILFTNESVLIGYGVDYLRTGIL